MTWKNRPLVMYYVLRCLIWFHFQKTLILQKIFLQGKSKQRFLKVFFVFLINERPLMNFAGKIHEALKVAQATTIYDVRIDFLFVKCAWPDCFFSLSSSKSNLVGAIQEFWHFEVTSLLDIGLRKSTNKSILPKYICFAHFLRLY